MSNNTATRQPKNSTLRASRRQLKSMATRLVGEDRILQAGISRKFSNRRRLGKKLVLVHTMGKVGSTTVAAALKTNGVAKKAIIFQPHFISPTGMAFAENLAVGGAGSWEKVPRKGRRGFLRNHMLNDELVKMRNDGERLTVISLVRDPVATNLSGLFHNNSWWPAELKNAPDDLSAEWNERMLQYFLADYPHDVPAEWFNWEVKGVYDIDVFATPFDPAAGYHIYRDDFTDLLVFRLESLDATASAAFAEFMDIPNFSMGRTNTASSKDYSAQYLEFRNSLVLPNDYLDRVYGSRMVQHFYSPDEIAAFRAKWSKGKQPD